MRLKITLVLATAVVLAGCGEKPKTTAGYTAAFGEPSLQETQAWMHSFAADRGAVVPAMLQVPISKSET